MATATTPQHPASQRPTRGDRAPGSTRDQRPPDPAPDAVGPACKLGVALAAEIESDIVAMGWPVGCVLGSEADLCARYGVGRGAFREAARLLEHHQVARMQRGRNGGLLVTAPTSWSVTTAMAIWFEHVSPSLADVHLVRRVLELLGIEAASRRITDADIASLRAVYHGETSLPSDPYGAHRQHQLLHQVLARASGNPALQVFVEALSRLTELTAMSYHEYEARRDTLERDIRHVHQAIGDAVIAGDVHKAQHLMSRHLLAIEHWQSRFRGGRVRATGLCFTPRPKSKRADAVASAIYGEIRAGDCPVGTVIGSQDELMQRHHVGRAVFREAVRLLEDHSVARMKKGPGGGLVATAPDEGALVKTVSSYLRFSGTAASDLVDVRTALELVSVATAAANPRRDLARLRVMAADDGCDPADFHLELADQAANPVLSLLMKVVIELWRQYPGPAGEPVARTGSARQHTAIVDAVDAGDAVVARRMVLRDSSGWHDTIGTPAVAGQAPRASAAPVPDRGAAGRDEDEARGLAAHGRGLPARVPGRILAGPGRGQSRRAKSG